MNSLTRLIPSTGASTVIFGDFDSAPRAFTPTLKAFKEDLEKDGTFVTPVREYEIADFMEQLVISKYGDAFDALQMKALTTGQRTPMSKVIENWVELSKLMDLFAAEYYEAHILPDYE
jgi:hypothetical protein